MASDGAMKLCLLVLRLFLPPRCRFFFGALPSPDVEGIDLNVSFGLDEEPAGCVFGLTSPVDGPEGASGLAIDSGPETLARSSRLAAIVSVEAHYAISRNIGSYGR